MSSSSFVPYMIDYNVESKGKTLGVTKKKVSFKFGFANLKALEEGLAGANCRGTEHEVILIWSLNSGKRQILADGREVHFSESRANGWTSDRSFQHVFSLRSPGYGSFKCHVICVPAQPGIKPFDLRINGIGIFQMCKIYQLGTPQMMSRPMPTVSGGPTHDPEVDPYATPEERRLIAQAKLESLRDIRQPSQSHTRTSLPPAPAPAPPRDEPSLISFDEDPVPPPPPPGQVGGSPGDRGVSGITMDPALLEQGSSGRALGQYGAPPPGQQPYGAPPPGQQQYGAPPPGSYPTSSALTPWQPQQSGGATAGTYGGAPSFAQPPQQQQQQQQPWNAAPPNPSWAAPAPSYGAPAPGYGAPPQQQPLSMDPYAAPSAAAPMPFASPSSAASYGSAPSFAQPPPAQPQTTYPQYTGY